jgi:hypothetical protein
MQGKAHTERVETCRADPRRMSITRHEGCARLAFDKASSTLQRWVFDPQHVFAGDCGVSAGVTVSKTRMFGVFWPGLFHGPGSCVIRSGLG